MSRTLINQLPTEPSPLDSSIRLYDVATIRRTAARCVDLSNDGLLAVADVDNWTSFAVFAFAMGESVRNGVVVDGPKMAFVFSGEGPASLRELRHTEWGEDGYLHYPSAKLIIAAFEALKDWFDV